MRARLSEEELRELHRIVQDAALEAYPNPTRNGCPGSAVLQEVARDRWPAAHMAYEHIKRCSPCLKEMLEFQDGVIARRKKERKQRKRHFLIGALASICLVGVVVPVTRFGYRSEQIPVISHRQDHLTIRTPPGILNFQTIAVDRGGQGNSSAPAQEQTISRSVRELAIVLPTGREAGTYILRVSSEVGGRELASYVGRASIDNEGVTTLRTAVDFRLFSPGTYQLTWHLRNSSFAQAGRFVLQ